MSIVMGILVLSAVFCSYGAEVEGDLKTDVKIITRLGSGVGFFTPALVKNNSLVYNSFEFNLYTNTDNTTYEIRLDNSTIRIDVIEEFKEVFYYNMTSDYIDLLEIIIGNQTYSYSNIRVMVRSIMDDNYTGRDEESMLEFTEEEFEDIIDEIKIMAFISNLLGAFLAGGVVYYYVTEHKKYLPEVIA